jgi:hypothetical protein
MMCVWLYDFLFICLSFFFLLHYACSLRLFVFLLFICFIVLGPLSAKLVISYFCYFVFFVCYIFSFWYFVCVDFTFLLLWCLYDYMFLLICFIILGLLSANFMIFYRFLFRFCVFWFPLTVFRGVLDIPLKHKIWTKIYKKSWNLQKVAPKL